MYQLNISKQTLTLEGKPYTHAALLKQIEDIPSGMPPIKQELFRFLKEWFHPSPELTIHTSGSTGTPKYITVKKEQMMRSAEMTCSFLQLKPGDATLLCLPLSYIAGKMIVVRALIAGLDLYPVAPCGNPLAEINVPLRFAALIPLQVYNSLLIPQEKEKLKQISNLIIGGGPIDDMLKQEIKHFPNAVYATYGMTETLSHIALQRLSGAEASNRYIPFQSVKLSLSGENTLVIHAPHVNDTVLTTNDIARLYPDNSFEIRGRKDNIINTGGLKVQIEEIENLIRPYIPRPFAITSRPHPKFGEIVVLLIEAPANPAHIRSQISEVLSPYQQPKEIQTVKNIPRTESGKINRFEVKQLANTL